MADTPRVAVLVNPERKALADDLLEALDAAGLTHTVIDVPEADALGELARRAADDGHPVIAAVGGDGTQRTVASALTGSDSALAIVPGGTVNLLGKVLGIHDVDEAVAAIAGGRTRELDVGEVDGDPFVLFATSGFDARVIEEVDEDAKRFGLLSYAVIGIRELRREQPRTVAVTVDGQLAWRGRAMGVMVTNVAQRGSETLEVAPDAEPDDGILDVVIQRCDSLPSMARAAVAMARRGRPDDCDVVYLRGGEVEVRWSGVMPVQRDGDPIERRQRISHRLRDERVRICTP